MEAWDDQPPPPINFTPSASYQSFGWILDKFYSQTRQFQATFLVATFSLVMSVLVFVAKKGYENKVYTKALTQFIAIKSE